jgi:glutamine amidotransferase-like uncharacterized protein
MTKWEEIASWCYAQVLGKSIFNITMKKFYNILLIALIVSFAIYLMHCNKDLTSIYDTSFITFDSVNVALYIDNAVWPDCKVNTENKLKEIGFAYTIINRDTILKGNLVHYSTLIMPGGRPDLYEQNLGQEAFDRIKNYASRGGGYIGICGGAYLASQINIWRGWAGEARSFYRYKGFLGFFKGTADGPIDDFAPEYIDFNCGVKLMNKEHPVVQGLSDTLFYLYDHGPMFTGNDPNVLPLGSSLKGNHVLILVTQYYNGRIFLTSGHPEVPDGVLCKELIKNAIIWCSKKNN